MKSASSIIINTGNVIKKDFCVSFSLFFASFLSLIFDPSHATGKSRLVAPMACAATAAGADGIMVEVHNDPAHALCDGAQSLTPQQFDEVNRRVRRIREVIV